MTSPLLSILIPVYNAEAYLEDCLESVTSQDYANIEIICIDDGSTDRSHSILEEWQRKDDRIIILQQENRGPSAARNKGIKASSGDYIAFVDADDIVKHNIYTKSIDIIKENELDALLFAFETFPCGCIRQHNFPTNVVMDYHQLFASNAHIQSSNDLCFSVRIIFRSSVIKDNHLEFDEEIRYGEDMVFNIEAICNSKRIMTISDALYMYRKNENGAMSQKHKPYFESSLVKAYDVKMNQIKKYGIDDIGKYRKDMAEYYIKEIIPQMIFSEYNRPGQNDISSAIKRILSLKMIRNYFDIVGFRNLYSSPKAYIMYLAQKFKIVSLVKYGYDKANRKK